MAYTYTYSKGVNSVNTFQLSKEIEASLPSCIVVFNNDGNLSIIYENQLSAGNETTLNSIVAAHSPVFTSEVDVFTNIGVNPRILTITSFGGDYNNLHILNWELYDLIRINCTSAATITGMTIRKNITFVNIGTKKVTFKHNSNLSLAENRMLLNGDKTISTDETRDFFYDNIYSRIRMKN